MEKRIVLDADGVILHFIDKFRECAQEVVGRELSCDNTAYALDEAFGITREQVGEVWKTFSQTRCWANIEPLPGAVSAIRDLEREGYEIHVVTVIPEEFRSDRLHNFRNFGFSPSSIHCAKHGHEGKSEPISKLDPLVFVDDRLEHLHGSQHVPVLVWVDLGQVQNPLPNCRHDATVSSLREWTDIFLANPSFWATKNPALSRQRSERLFRDEPSVQIASRPSSIRL